MTITVIVGNPKPGSRTARAATMLATALAGKAPDAVIDVGELGPALLSQAHPAVEAAVATLGRSRIAVVASPTFKATFSRWLKLLLDQIPGRTGMQGVVGVPLMLGASATNALAAEHSLKPVLVELGATCPAPGLFLLDKAFEDGLAIQSYADRWGPSVRACAGLSPLLREPTC